MDVILKQDLLDLYAIRSIQSIQTMISLLQPRIGQVTVYNNLARDLQVDGKSVRSWIHMLENLYLLFRVTPYHTNIARSILKEPKLYFFDCAKARDPGARLENLVACALLKEVHFIQDFYGFPCVF